MEEEETLTPSIPSLSQTHEEEEESGGHCDGLATHRFFTVDQNQISGRGAHSKAGAVEDDPSLVWSGTSTSMSLMNLINRRMSIGLRMQLLKMSLRLSGTRTMLNEPPARPHTHPKPMTKRSNQGPPDYFFWSSVWDE